MKIAEKMACGSALFLRLWHLRHLALWVIVDRGRREHCANLILGLALRLLQEIPERIDQYVVCGGALVSLRPAGLAYPVNCSPFFGSKADGGPVSIVRDVLLSRAHGFNFLLAASSHCYIFTL